MSFDPTTHNGATQADQGAAAEPQSPTSEDVAEAARAQDTAAGAQEAAAPAVSPLTAEELSALAARAEKADEYLALAQRKQAEFENFRKRAARDSAAAAERGASRLAIALLPALDNLERALAHAPADADEHGFVAGVRHVHSDLLGALTKAGIEQYSPAGEPFDPTLHEAVAQAPTEGAEAGTVVEVYQCGYRMGESVVRPARVVVAG